MKTKPTRLETKLNVANPNGQLAVHDTQRLNKKQRLKKSITTANLAQKNLAKQNLRTVMQALHGCRKNCRQCKDDEANNFGEPKII